MEFSVQRIPLKTEVVFEVGGSGLTDLIEDRRFDETEDGEGEVRLGGGGGEREAVK